MNVNECFKKINLKLSRIDLTEFKKINLHEEEQNSLDIEVWCDSILAWLGTFHKPENDRRFLALEKTVKAGGTTWYEYFKSCEALIDAYNKKQALRLFANKLFEQEETIPIKVDAHQVTTIKASVQSVEISEVDKLKKQVSDVCELFKSVFEESPNPIHEINYYIENIKQ